jgi:hypothetical protein
MRCLCGAVLVGEVTKKGSFSVPFAAIGCPNRLINPLKNLKVLSEMILMINLINQIKLPFWMAEVLDNYVPSMKCSILNFLLGLRFFII